MAITSDIDLSVLLADTEAEIMRVVADRDASTVGVYEMIRYHLGLDGDDGPRGKRMRPLLATNLAEHEQVAAQQGRLAWFAAVTAPVLLLCGGRTPSAISAGFETLRDTLPHATLDTMSGLNHFGPEGKSAGAVAERLAAFLR